MPDSEFHLRMRSLLELTQTGTVAEYTTLFWEHLHHVLHLNSSLSIKSFIHQYIEGLRKDIQADVQSQSPSSITRASCLARIREEEIMKDEATSATEGGDSYGYGEQDSGVDANKLATLKPTMCSMECPSRDATVNIFPELASPAGHDEALDIDIDTVHVAGPMPAIFSMGDLAHGSDDDGPMSVSMVLWTTPAPPQRPVPNLELITMTPTSCLFKSSVKCAYVLTPGPMSGLTMGLKAQGRGIRPAPWPSFLQTC
ncbi:hypothetical protein VPH35_062665 [Triticum aestivum]